MIHFQQITITIALQAEIRAKDKVAVFRPFFKNNTAFVLIIALK